MSEEMVEVLVHVTKEDVEQGVSNDFRCPIALSLRRVVSPSYCVRVASGDDLRVHRRVGETVHHKASVARAEAVSEEEADRILKFINTFDANQESAEYPAAVPTTFKILVPSYILRSTEDEPTQ